MEVVAAYRKGKYTLTLHSPGRTMAFQYRLDDGFRSDWPIRYRHNGKFGYDNPEWFPPYIRKWAENKITKLETK